jgi:hypothetical protein
VSKGDIKTAPGFLRGAVRWRVRIEGRPRNKNVLVTWLDGPLRGRPARLEARTLE